MNVFWVAVAYVVAGWVLAQVAETLEDALNLPQWFDTVIIAALIIGLPIALLLSWAFELRPEGVKKTEEVNAPSNSLFNREFGPNFTRDGFVQDCVHH